MNSKKILVCDDDQGIVDVLEVMLEMQGFTPITEIDSTKVIKKIHENKPDLILLDLWMPLISGEQILRSIRSIADLKDIPVIVFSASVEGDAIAFEAGADSFIAKPFDMNEIISKINLLLEKHSESNTLMQL